ncbi:MAG: tetratricopeptide repeat protein [Bacteroidia bacterium]|nr:tetratricopeptide repeat protein [Bacteroidia bacterium]
MTTSSLLRAVPVWLLASALALPLAAQKRPDRNAAPPAADPAKRQQTDQYYLDACTYLMRGDYRSAAEWFHKTLELDPGNAAVLYSLARVHTELRQYDEAIAYARQAIEADAGQYWYHDALVQASVAQGNLSGAIEALEALTARFPDRSRDRMHLAELYVRMEQPEQARRQLARIEETDGPSIDLALYQHQLARRRSDWEGCLQAARTLIRLAPDELGYYEREYEALVQLGRKAEALGSLEQSLRANPDRPFALLTVGRHQLLEGDRKQGAAYLQRAFALPEVEVRVKSETLRQALAAEVPASLLMDLARTLYRMHPGHADAAGLLGELFRRSGQTDSAYRYLRAALDTDPNDLAGWISLLETARAAGRYRAMLESAEEARDLFPNQGRVLLMYGIAAGATGQAAAGIPALEKIRRLGLADAATMAEASRELGVLHLAAGKPAEAEAALRQALAQAPADAGTMAWLGVALLESKPAEAKKLITDAQRLASDLPAVHYAQGRQLLAEGNLESALPRLRKAAASGYPPFLRALGEALRQAGETREAAELLERACESLGC